LWENIGLGACDFFVRSLGISGTRAGSIIDQLLVEHVHICLESVHIRNNLKGRLLVPEKKRGKLLKIDSIIFFHLSGTSRTVILKIFL